MWAGMVKKFGGWILAAISFVVMVATFVFSVRKNAKTDAAAKYTEQKAADREALAVRQVVEERAAAKTEVDTLKGVQNVQAEVSSSDDAAVRDRLRDEWSRD